MRCINHLMDHDAPVDLNGAVIYHCGPVMLKDEAAGTLKRPDRQQVSARSHTKAILLRSSAFARLSAKAAWDRKHWLRLQEHGGVYLNAIGGAAQYYAECFKNVNGVDFMEFGIPEAMWHLQDRRLRCDRDDGLARQQLACRGRKGFIREAHSI